MEDYVLVPLRNFGRIGQRENRKNKILLLCIHPYGVNSTELNRRSICVKHT